MLAAAGATAERGQSVANQDTTEKDGVVGEIIPGRRFRVGLAAAPDGRPAVASPSSVATGTGLSRLESRLAGVAQVKRGMSRDTGEVADYAIGRVRDLFLAALDEADPGRTLEIAVHLVSCGNPLPNATCVALGLPSGSSYGAGARAVLAKAPGRT